MGRTEADRSKQDPRRWFILHISESKEALMPEKSIGLRENPPKSGFYNVHAPEKPTVALNRDIALNGPQIWKQRVLTGVFFFTDAIKSAIETKGLRTHAIKFNPCLLV